MAIEGLYITTEALESTAQTIESRNNQLYETLDDISKNMLALRRSWNSPAAEEIRAKMEKMRPLFDNYREIIDQYAKFLKNAAREFAAVEGQIQGNASKF